MVALGFRGMMAGAAAMLGSLGVRAFLPGVTNAPPAAPVRRRQRFNFRRMSILPSGWNSTTWHHENGRRERERRLRQIVSGRLRVANGIDPNVIIRDVDAGIERGVT